MLPNTNSVWVALGIVLVTTIAAAQEVERFGKKVMTVAARDRAGVTVVDISCDGVPTNHCRLSGTHIYRQAHKPLGAIGDPVKTCYVEVGTSELNVHEVNGKLISEDGPGGMCETTIISTVDFGEQKYSLRHFSNSKSGPICSAQKDEYTEYTTSSAIEIQTQLQWSGVEIVPSLWQP
jgi:hypothetical protein